MLQEDIQAGQCRNALTGYKKDSEELTEVGGLITREEKLVLLKELQPAAIKLAHEGHLGQEKTLGLPGVYILSPNLISFRNNFTIEIEKINNFRGGQ